MIWDPAGHLPLPLGVHRCGFRTVGVRERIGRHHGAWRDVILIERRSPEIT